MLEIQPPNYAWFTGDRLVGKRDREDILLEPRPDVVELGGLNVATVPSVTRDVPNFGQCSETRHLAGRDASTFPE
jgi:hypothetical protein